MLANVLHTTLNTRGGSERLAMASIKALTELGVSIHLSTMEPPIYEKIQAFYGRDILQSIYKLKTLNNLLTPNRVDATRYDLVINTHGDILPYYKKNLGRKNYITYCHFPIAKYLLDTKESTYSSVVRSMSQATFSDELYKNYLNIVDTEYVNMMKNSTVLTNSKYSQDAIMRLFNIDSIVLSPPVDTDVFRNSVLLFSDDASAVNDFEQVGTDENCGTILVISRFNPSKKIENALILAKLLKENEIGQKMIVAGNLSADGLGYFSYLKQLVVEYDLANYVTFEINVHFERLLYLMRKSKVYFHPLPGEPFGMSTVEAMSAGLVPVVPDIGGHTEFVPEKYQFHTFGQGVEVIARAMAAPYSERVEISNSVSKFSTKNYIRMFKDIISNTITLVSTPNNEPQDVPFQELNAGLIRPVLEKKNPSIKHY